MQKIQTQNEKLEQFNKLLSEINFTNMGLETEKINYEILFAQKDFFPLLLDLIPEWKRLINCNQHKIHDFTLDVHTMLVLKRVVSDAQYQHLDRYDKLLISYTALLHDIAKNADSVDPNHPEKGAVLATDILYRLGFEESFILKVYTLIKYHQYLGLMAVGKLDIKDVNLEEIFINTNILKLAKILAVADIASVQRNCGFWSKEKEENFSCIYKQIQNKLL